MFHHHFRILVALALLQIGVTAGLYFNPPSPKIWILDQTGFPIPAPSDVDLDHALTRGLIARALTDLRRRLPDIRAEEALRQSAADLIPKGGFREIPLADGPNTIEIESIERIPADLQSGISQRLWRLIWVEITQTQRRRYTAIIELKRHASWQSQTNPLGLYLDNLVSYQTDLLPSQTSR